MAYFFPEGSQFAFSTTLATAVNITAITNANPAVATAAAHGYSNNDELLLTSGWEDANNTIFRAGSVATNTFNVTGLNSTNTSFYPAGGGTGTARRLSGWQSILQVLSVTSQGGDARFTQIQPLSARNAFQVPTGFNPSSFTMTLGYDPSIASFQTLIDLSRILAPLAMRITLSGNGAIYFYGYISISEVPQMQPQSPLTVQAAVTNLGRIISY